MLSLKLNLWHNLQANCTLAFCKIIGLLAAIINCLLQPLGLEIFSANLLNIVAKLAQKIVLAIGYCFPCCKLDLKSQLINFWVVFLIAVINLSLLI
jgi:hypothetical protein